MEVCNQSSWILHLFKTSQSHHLAGMQLYLISIQKKNLAASGNAVSSIFAVNFLPARWKRKDKLKQMEKDSWENSLLWSKIKGAWFDNSVRLGLGEAVVDCPGHLCFKYGFWRCPEALHGLAQFWLILMACTGGSNLFSYPTEGWAGIHPPSCCEICCMWYFSLLVTELTSQVERIIWTQLLITVKCRTEEYDGEEHFWFQKLDTTQVSHIIAGFKTGSVHLSFSCIQT